MFSTLAFLYICLQLDATTATEEVKPETDNPDWFKDALKRAQAKAKELSEIPPGWLILICIHFIIVVIFIIYYFY